MLPLGVLPARVPRAIRHMPSQAAGARGACSAGHLMRARVGSEERPEAAGRACGWGARPPALGGAASFSLHPSEPASSGKMPYSPSRAFTPNLSE